MKTNALQAEYENINLGIMSSYLSLLHNTKIAVLKTLEDFVKEADLNLEPNKIDILQSKLDIDIDQIFNLIAENDAI